MLLEKYGQDFDLDRFHACVRENYKIHCGIEEMATFLSVSTSKLQTDFKAVHGESYYSFMKKVALKKAAKLLKESSLRITDIATEIGYMNMSKFSSAFKKQYEITPTEYREKFKVK